MNSINLNGREFYASRVYEILGIEKYSPKAGAGCIPKMRELKPGADAGDEADLMAFSELAKDFRFRRVATPEAKFTTDLFLAIEDPEVGLYSSYLNYLLRGGPLTNKKALVFEKPGRLLQKLHPDGALFRFHEDGNESYAVMI